jgi:uncharacterized membrane protein (DUF4010 family)
MNPETLPLINLATALGIGLLVGAERERRKGSGPSRAIAGLRTFAVTAMLGAVCMLTGDELLLAVATAGVTAFAALGYWRNRDADPGLTTEIALLLTLLLGALTIAQPALAASLGVMLAVLLAAKSRLHHFVKAVMTERELGDALILAAATLIVLPLIPDRHIGPFDAINPRNAWTIVVVIMCIGALGHIALRALGPRFGLPLAGLASGFISSTATIMAMGERAKRTTTLMPAAVAAATLSTLATVLQLVAVLAIANTQVLKLMALPLLLAGLVAVVYGGFFSLHSLRGDGPDTADAKRAFNITTALVLAAALSAMLLLSAALDAWLGKAGVLAAAAVSGLADAHAAAASVASLVAGDRLDAADAALPILAAFTTNTISKCAAAIVAGGRRYALKIIPGLLLTAAAAWLGLLLQGQ